MEAQTVPVIVYSREMGQYAERCGINELDAALKAFGVNSAMTTAIILAEDDVRHTHHDNGECIAVFVNERSRAAVDMRVRMGRAFVAGRDIYVA